MPKGATSPFPGGTHGGALHCGSTTFGAVQETMCAWSDGATVGLITSVNPPRGPDDLAAVANQFRDALD